MLSCQAHECIYRTGNDVRRALLPADSEEHSVLRTWPLMTTKAVPGKTTKYASLDDDPSGFYSSADVV